ncbi:MAG: phosphoribosylglycinamide formyltransferase [Rhodocyclaceae bacterium]|nr:phosphoribosylglycinamide formyltransferase [Rhodocyclaceae bacterium]
MSDYAILISGRGSNMQALVSAALPGRCVGVLSNRPEAAGLCWAAAQGIPVAVIDHKQFSERAAFDQALAEELERRGAQWVFLAGFMRVLGEAFVARFSGRLINIHPSLLPAFPGLHTHAAALAAGVRIHGCTVHFVTAAVDAGPIIVQAAVPVLPDDDAERLAARVLAQEHRIYPYAARALLEGRCRLVDGRVVWQDGQCSAQAALRVPGP